MSKQKGTSVISPEGTRNNTGPGQVVDVPAQGSNILKPLLSVVKKLLHNKRFLIVLAVVVIIAGGIGVGLFLKHKHDADIAKRTPKSGSQDLNNQVNDLLANKKYTEASQLIKNSAQDPKSKEALELQAVVLQNSGDYKGALKQWLSIEETSGLDANIAHNIAETAEKAGDKQTAISYYQKAIDLTKKSPYPASDSDIAYYQSRIKALQ